MKIWNTVQISGVTVTNTNDTGEEIKCRINKGNASYYSLGKILSSHLLSKKLKVNTYTVNLLYYQLYCLVVKLGLSPRERQSLRVYENEVLRKTFRAKRDEITGEWRKLHNAKPHALHSSPNIIKNLKSRRLRWSGHVARMEQSRNAYKA